MSLESAVNGAIDDLGLSEPDKGAAELALAYARHIDGDGDIDKTGPLLLAVLESLLMTPRARAAVVKGGGDAGAGPLDQLRARRAARLDDAANLDTTAS